MVRRSALVAPMELVLQLLISTCLDIIVLIVLKSIIIVTSKKVPGVQKKTVDCIYFLLVLYFLQFDSQ